MNNIFLQHLLIFVNVNENVYQSVTKNNTK